VHIYKEYARHRPADYCAPDARFYLKPLKDCQFEQWFSMQPMGKNTIGAIAKQMAFDASLSSAAQKSNHSGRKTVIQTLLHAGVPPTDVIQLTGHKNVQSLNSYSHLSNGQQRNISNLLTNKLSRDTATISQAAATRSLHSQSNVNFVMEIGMANDEIANILNEPFDEQTSHFLPSQQACTNHVVTQLRKLPSSSSVHNNFLNGTINGNITININHAPAKRCRTESPVESDAKNIEE
jgi:hypothetical protein